MSEAPVRRGTVAAAVAEEFPRLGVAFVTIPWGGAERSDPGVRERLALLASRIGGAQALALRQGEVPHAHRVFFRHVGLDPDVVHTPVEAAVLQRLLEGGFPARDRITDARLLAVVETGVGVWAWEAGADDDVALELRAAVDGDGIEPGRLLVADAAGPIAPLFEDVPAARVPTASVGLFAIQVPGVADAYVDEALRIAADAVT